MGYLLKITYLVNLSRTGQDVAESWKQLRCHELDKARGFNERLGPCVDESENDQSQSLATLIFVCRVLRNVRIEPCSTSRLGARLQSVHQRTPERFHAKTVGGRVCQIRQSCRSVDCCETAWVRIPPDGLQRRGSALLCSFEQHQDRGLQDEGGNGEGGEDF